MTGWILVKDFDTVSSEVKRRTFFKSRYTKYVPDFFFILVYIFLFLASGVLDRIFLFLVFTKDGGVVLGSLLLLCCFSSILYFIIQRLSDGQYLSDVDLNRFSQVVIYLMLILFGFDPVFMGGRLLMNAFDHGLKGQLSLNTLCNSYRFFHLSESDLCSIKNYCYVCVGLKVIPRLVLVPTVLLTAKLDNFFVAVGTLSLLIDMIIFSVTIAITLPIRKTSRIFSNSLSVLMNSFSKFMGTFCACGGNVALYAMIFKNIRYYTLIIMFVKFVFSSWPSWSLFARQFQPYPRLKFILYGFFFSFVFNFIYIHPFEGRGKLYYYFFNLINFVFEIALIYLFSDVDEDGVSIFFGLHVLKIGFVSCFGLTNILQKVDCFPLIQKLYVDETTSMTPEESDLSVQLSQKDSIPAPETPGTSQ